MNQFERLVLRALYQLICMELAWVQESESTTKLLKDLHEFMNPTDAI